MQKVEKTSSSENNKCFNIEAEQQELDNLPQLSEDEQKLVDLLAGLMVDQYFATIEKKGTIKDE